MTELRTNEIVFEVLGGEALVTDLENEGDARVSLVKG